LILYVLQIPALIIIKILISLIIMVTKTFFYYNYLKNILFLLIKCISIEKERERKRTFFSYSIFYYVLSACQTLKDIFLETNLNTKTKIELNWTSLDQTRH